VRGWLQEARRQPLRVETPHLPSPPPQERVEREVWDIAIPRCLLAVASYDEIVERIKAEIAAIKCSCEQAKDEKLKAAGCRRPSFRFRVS
jgi:hypothetical protein